MAEKRADRAQLKLNTDESPGVATEYGIRSIPTVMVFKVRRSVSLTDATSTIFPCQGRALLLLMC